MPLLSVEGLSKSYGPLRALVDVAFSVREGEILGLLGPNGAGKTTLFECLAGVRPPDSAQVKFARHGARRADSLFYVPDGIVPWAEQTVEWGLRYVEGVFGGQPGVRRDVADRLDLGSLLRTRIGSLSKGQRKRALVAIGMLTPQPLLLIDEPFEGLDLRQGREAAAALRWHASAAGRSLFLSIHHVSHAARFCDRFVLLSGGRVCGEGTFEELARLAASRSDTPPATDFEEVFLALT